MITVLDDAARVNENGAQFAGLDRYEARRQIVEALQARGDLESIKPHEMLIGRCQRSDDVVEPRLKTQWFVRVAPLAAAALEATRSGKTQILPERFVKVWEHWMTEMRDWNVSRQLWWGHRIPAWYCPDGHTTVTADPGRARRPARCAAVRQRTCARTRTSSTPGSARACGRSRPWAGPRRRADLARFYPGSVMETGYDIIFFWVARMMMLGIHLTGEAPFHTVYLSGLIRDPYGQKMSKTKGNSVDPLETIEEVGADALRFALVNGTAPGNDSRLGAEKLENSRNFTNKLWNVARFVLGRGRQRSRSMPRVSGPTAATPARAIGGSCPEPQPRSRPWTWPWLPVRLRRCQPDPVRGDLERVLRLGRGAGQDPPGRREPDAAEREATWWTLVEVLDTYLRLLHPVMPFVTEAIWAALPHAAADPGLLIVADWPTAGAEAADVAAETEVAALLDLVRAVRNARAEARIEPAAWLPVDVYVPESLGPTLRRSGRRSSGWPGPGRSAANSSPRVRSDGAWRAASR